MRDFDQQPITIHSALSFATYNEYCLFYAFRGRFYLLKKWSFFIGFPLLTLVLWLQPAAIEFRIFASLFLLLIYLISLFRLWLYPRRYFKNSPAIFQISMCYQFRNHQLELSHSGNLAKGLSELSYQAIYKVYERPGVFYIFISPNQAYLIEKSKFDNDTPDTLRQLLQSVLPAKKYCICG